MYGAPAEWKQGFMTDATHFVLVGAGGAIGAMARYGVGRVCAALWGGAFPVGTFVVNVLGAIAMGFFVHWLALRPEASPEVPSGALSARLFFAVGVLGAFTTFSTFSLDAITLYKDRNMLMAAVYVGASVTVSIAGLMGGIVIARNWWS